MPSSAVAKRGAADLARYDPDKGLKSIAVAEAAEKHFARAKDATKLQQAIRLGNPKPEPRAVTKRRREKLDAKDERAAREIVRKRDGGKCRIPGCSERATELHHIVYRSKSKGARWLPANLVPLCTDHHRLEHAGTITISGNADEEIIVTGDVDRLRFRL